MNKEFEAALDRCGVLAGEYEGWNKRYREALAAAGIIMVEDPSETLLDRLLAFVPHDWLWAPWPTEEPAYGWSKRTALIWSRPS
jgi:hypothetical protein